MYSGCLHFQIESVLHLWEGGEGGSGEDLKKKGKRAYSKITGLHFFAQPCLVQQHFVLSLSLVSLIKYSAHLKEIDLGNNVLGEKAAVDLLEALRARKTGRCFQFVFPFTCPHPLLPKCCTTHNSLHFFH